MSDRYHVVIGGKRTTVSLDTILSAYLAIKLGTVPETKEAHQQIRLKLQTWLDESDDPGRIRVSQWLTGRAVELIADKVLSAKYDEWVLTG